jgi:hypothetical protein
LKRLSDQGQGNNGTANRLKTCFRRFQGSGPSSIKHRFVVRPAVGLLGNGERSRSLPAPAHLRNLSFCKSSFVIVEDTVGLHECHFVPQPHCSPSDVKRPHPVGKVVCGQRMTVTLRRCSWRVDDANNPLGCDTTNANTGQGILVSRPIMSNIPATSDEAFEKIQGWLVRPRRCANAATITQCPPRVPPGLATS